MGPIKGSRWKVDMDLTCIHPCASEASLRPPGLSRPMTSTVGRINFEDKNFRGYLLNLEIKYPRKFPA